jgi:hypothetical protein
MISPNDPPRSISLRAMYREGENERELLESPTDPIRILSACMKTKGLKPEIFFEIEYDDFEAANHYKTRFRMGLEKAGSASFECLGE